MANLAFDTMVQGDVTVVSVRGRVDSNTVGALRAALNEAASAERAWVVGDFSGVDFMSSASLRVLLDVLKSVRSRDGDLRLAAVRPEVARIFDLAGFAGILQMYPDVEAAVASYGASKR
ncbi:MAG TPA: STAS domain-containing protein [Anaerolineales bacterium]|nr:STAS domain-containing protein [Anaerolineales bacterium]